MNEDVHHIDDLFRSALEHNEETPSPAVKESLNTTFNKNDAESYKRKYTVWKRVTILLFMLLTGFILYESGLLKKDSGHLKENTSIKKSGTPKMPYQQDIIKNAGTNDANNKVMNKKAETSNNAITPAGDLFTKQHQKEITGINIFDTIKHQRNLHKTAGQKPVWANRKKGIVYDSNQTGITIISSNHDKNVSRKLKNYESLPKEKINLVVPNEKNIAGKISNQLIINNTSLIPILSDSFSKTKGAKKRQQKKASNFKTDWLITGVASYDQVNYKLDSDLPGAINNIRHREEHEPSFSGGFLVARQIKKHWALQTGLIYSYTAIGISPQKIYAFQEPAGSIAYKYITSSGYAYIKPGTGAPTAIGDSLTTAEAEHTLQSISVPFLVKYSFEKNKFMLRPGVGVEANLLASTKVEVEVEDTPNREIVFINRLNGAKSFYWSLNANVELQYKVNKKLYLMLRPAFRYALSPITEDNVVETFPYSFGLGMGLTYKF
jgi:hypothetical protein